MSPAESDLTLLLHQTRDENIANALQALSRNGLPHYSEAAQEQNRERLTALYDAAVESIARRTLEPTTRHARAVANERFKAGFDLHEVHTAFNVLEEALWRTITQRLEPSRYPEALGMVSTVLGAGKEALAVEYVALAGHGSFRSLDLTALFHGTA